MPSYTIAADDGSIKTTSKSRTNEVFHVFALKGNPPPTAGTVVIKGRLPGADDFTEIGTYDFTSPSAINHIGPIQEWEFTTDSVDSSLLHITITSTQTGKSNASAFSPEDQAKLDAITNIGSGQIITLAERNKLTAITNTGSGLIITTEERDKLTGLANITEEDQLMEGLALGGLYVKNAQVG
ncbi:hypothetical protein [uncultured Mediterranean phage uvMED]|nr:hypothetical protein [uncultured Mediterranean phage uvMED]